MARRRKKRVVRPRVPARVKKTKTKRAKRARGHQHPELIGLVMTALGVFLVTVGSLMLARSDLVDVRPFRTGLAVSSFGLMLALGGHGGYVGDGLNNVFGALLGDTGAAIAGGTALLAGALLLTGASAGALLRRGATAARRSFDRPLRERVSEPPELISTANAAHVPLVDAAAEYPDVIGMAEPAPLIPFPEPDTQESPDQESLFNASPAVEEYRLPDRSLLRSSGTKGNAS